MRVLGSSRPLLARAAAVLFAAATTLYSLAWMYSVRIDASGYLGIDPQVSRDKGLAIRIRSVAPGSAAEAAGLRAGDRLVGIAGRRFETYVDFTDAVGRGRPGERVSLLVERPGSTRTEDVEAVLGSPPPEAPQPLVRRIAGEATGLYPLLFLAALIAVLVLRPDEPNAWLLALLFASLLSGAPLSEAGVARPLRGFMTAYRIFFGGMQGAAFVFFFSVFPAPSPLDRRAPWVKWLWAALSAALAAPIAAVALATGGGEPVGVWLHGNMPFVIPLLQGLAWGGCVLGLLSLLANGVAGSALVKRKVRVMVWGSVLCLLPLFVVFGLAQFLGVPLFELPFAFWGPWVILGSLFPLPFVYTVVRYRVLEIPALLRRSARYLLVQRGALGLLALLGVAAAAWFSISLGHLAGPGAQPLLAGLGVGFGTVLVWTGTRVQRRVSERIDRAFFRSAYDARRILEELAEKMRVVASRADVTSLLEQYVVSGLYPASLAIFLDSGDGVLRRAGTGSAAEPAALPGASPLLDELLARGQPLELPPAGSAQDAPWVRQLGAECLVPILGRQGRLRGLLALGPRLSEEPYSRDARRLLASVASQAGIALDSLLLAEAMAERLEAERVAVHERLLAQQVQSRLLPQTVPLLESLDLAGRCVQARAVGGDYYDFLELGDGNVGLALADISGKGFPAALLMASLQASLRSRTGADLRDLPRQLRAVNQLLHRSSESSRYATLFLGLYDDAARRLLFANCGHNPPLLLRRSGEVERLAPTAPVLGLLDELECTTAERALEPGDLLAVFSDGITEAWSPPGEEYGEARLLELLRAMHGRSAAELVERVLAEVQAWSGGEQHDDQTLLIARVR